MPFKLTDAVMENLWGEAELQGLTGRQNTDTDILDWATLPHIGNCWSCCTPLSNGLEIVVEKWEVAEDLLYSTPAREETGTGTCLVFNFSCQVQTHMPGLVEEMEETVGYYHLENNFGIAETELWQAGEPFHRLYLGIDSGQLLNNFTSQQMAQLPVELRLNLEGDPFPYYRSHLITPEINQVLHQILHCPYEGLLKRMYLQGKAWELIALAFTPLSPEPPAVVDVMKPEEVERIHHAKDLLIAQIQNPPCVTDLARQAGLNEFSLRQGFRRIFGTTVFRYLHDYRLDLARQLLSDRPLRIEEVSHRVGFANRGYFAAAFRKKFGVSPKVYRQQTRNSLK